MYNAALDFAVLDNRIKFTVEAYMSKTKDLLLTVQRPTQSGYSNRFMNVGKTSNKGIEIAIESYNISKPKFTWSTSFTLSHNSQMVDNIGSEDFVVTYESYNPKYMMYGYVSDYPLNALWGFRYAGTWKNNAEIERNKTTKGYVSAGNNFYSPGAPRYLDINHDGILNKQDLVYLGQADPISTEVCRTRSRYTGSPSGFISTTRSAARFTIFRSSGWVTTPRRPTSTVTCSRLGIRSATPIRTFPAPIRAMVWPVTVWFTMRPSFV